MTNISSNPIAALTRLVAKDAATIPGLSDIAATLIREALEVAAAALDNLRSLAPLEKAGRLAVVDAPTATRRINEGFQFIAVYHPVDFIRAMGEAYEHEQAPAAKNAEVTAITVTGCVM